MARNLTVVRLLSVPLENDYKHTFYFIDKGSQESYFSGKVQHTANECTYQRKDNVIRFPKQYDDIYGCNYVMYKNSAYSDKWYYAFITKKEYVNDERTDIYIETDVIQTYLFEYTVQPSFIEREHVDDDTRGMHTVPELLETGEYVCNAVVTDDELKDYVYVMQVTEWTSGTAVKWTNFGGVVSAGGAYICESGAQVADILTLYENEGKADTVFSVYMIPKKIITYDGTHMQYSGQGSPTTYTIKIGKQLILDGYIPRNNKLYCFPYNYMLLSNNSGTSNILQYEHFSGNLCTFEVQAVPTVGGSIKCVPTLYKGVAKNQQEGIMLGKFPTCSWSTDLYTNWLTQNAVNIGVGIASGGAQILGGAVAMASGNPLGVGLMANGAVGVAQTLGQVYQQSFTPPSAEGNTNGGDINTCNKMNLFHFYQMSIKAEYAKIIDGYFDMYGYKVNTVKRPSIAHRENYWYTKTIGVNIDGNIPMEDMKKIKQCYDTGITFWWNPANIGNYSVSNGIKG